MDISVWADDIDSVEYDPDIPAIRLRFAGGSKLTLFTSVHNTVNEAHALEGLADATRRAQANHTTD